MRFKKKRRRKINFALFALYECSFIKHSFILKNMFWCLDTLDLKIKVFYTLRTRRLKTCTCNKISLLTPPKSGLLNTESYFTCLFYFIVFFSFYFPCVTLIRDDPWDRRWDHSWTNIKVSRIQAYTLKFKKLLWEKILKVTCSTLWKITTFLWHQNLRTLKFLLHGWAFFILSERAASHTVKFRY